VQTGGWDGVYGFGAVEQKCRVKKY